MFNFLTQYLIPSVSVLLALFAGWFIATDKNRAELFRRKLNAYDILFEQIQILAILSIATKLGNANKSEVLNLKASLTQTRYSKILYISGDVQKELSKLYDADLQDPEEVLSTVSNLANLASKDLGIKRQEFISKLSILELKKSAHLEP